MDISQDGCIDRLVLHTRYGTVYLELIVIIENECPVNDPDSGLLMAKSLALPDTETCLDSIIAFRGGASSSG